MSGGLSALDPRGKFRIREYNTPPGQPNEYTPLPPDDVAFGKMSEGLSTLDLRNEFRIREYNTPSPSTK